MLRPHLDEHEHKDKKERMQCYLPKSKCINPDSAGAGAPAKETVVDHHLAFISQTLRVEIPPPWHSRACGTPPYRLAGRRTTPAQVEAGAVPITEASVRKGAHADTDIPSDAFSKQSPPGKSHCVGT